MELNEELVALVTQKVLETLRAGETAPAGSQAAGLRMTVRDGEEAKPGVTPDEVVIGAKVTLANAEGTEAVAVTETDDFGDFWFRQMEPAAYTVWVEAEGYLPRHFPVDAGAADVNAGPLAVYVAAEQA